MRKMLITGTTQGIGNHLYKEFLTRYEVTTLNRRPFPGDNIICDLSNVTATEVACREISTKGFDIVINNAGGATPLYPYDVTASILTSCSNLNYHSPVLIMNAVLDGMARRGYGRIINMSSIASKAPRQFLACYGASKAALERYTTSLATYYSGKGITINCVCPGGVQTDTSCEKRREISVMMGFEKEHRNNRFAEENGLGRMVRTEEVVALIEYLISDKAAAVSGQAWNICGVSEVC